MEYASSYPLLFLLSVACSLFVSSAFLISSLVSKADKYPIRLRADLASFSSGMFLGTVTFSIFDEAIKLGDIFTTGIGFAIGASTFSIVRRFLHNKSNSDKKEQTEEMTKRRIIYNDKNMDIKEKEKEKKRSDKGSRSSGGSGQMVIIGTLADSHPETLMIGMMVAIGISGLLPTVIALFIGNLTATVVGTRQMIEEGIPKKKIIRKWYYVFVAVFVGGIIGFFLPMFLTDRYMSIIFSFAAGALISFVTEELIPDAYKKVNWHIGLSAALGLFISFALFHFL